MSDFFRGVRAIVWKDLVMELRTKELFSSMFLFSLLVLVIFDFALTPGMEEAKDIIPGALWVAFTFAGILGLNRSFIYEKEKECIQGLMLCPLSSGVIYLGKMVGNFIFISIVEIISLPIFALLFNIEIANRLPQLLLIIFLSTVGFSSVGTLFSAISVNTKAREVMLPILLFPIIVPLIIAAVKATGRILGDGSLEQIMSWIKLLAGFDIIFLVISYLTFDFVIEE